MPDMYPQAQGQGHIADLLMPQVNFYKFCKLNLRNFSCEKVPF